MPRPPMITGPSGTGPMFDLGSDIDRALQEEAKAALKKREEQQAAAAPARDPQSFGDTFGNMFSDHPGGQAAAPVDPNGKAAVEAEIRAKAEEDHQATLAKLDQFSGGGMQAPPTAIDVHGQVSQGSAQGAMDIANMLASGYGTQTVRNPHYESTKQVTDAALGPDGFVQRQHDGAVAAGQAEIDAQKSMSEYMAQQGLRTELEQAVQRDREMAYDYRLRAQEESVQTAEAAVSRAKRALQEQPDVDPDRFWADKGAGFKVLAVLQGVLSGFVGQDATKILKDAIQTDIEAQRTNVGKRESEVGAAVDAANQAHQTYREIMAEVGDQRQADLLYESARLEAAKEAFLQKQQEFGIQVLDAKQQEFVAKIDEELALNRQQYQRFAAANAPTFTRRVDLLGPDRRRALQAIQGEQIKTSGDAARAGLQHTANLELEGVKQQGAVRAKAIETNQKRIDQGRQELTKRVAPFTSAIGLIDDALADYEETGTLSGRGLGDKTFWAGANYQDAILPVLGQAVVEGALQEHEMEMVKKLITSGWGSETGAANLRLARKVLSHKIDAARRGFDDDVVRAVTGDALTPGAAPSSAGYGGGQSVVSED